MVIVRYEGDEAAAGGAITEGTGAAEGYTVHTFDEVGTGTLDFSSLDLNERLGATITGVISGDGDLSFSGPGTLTLDATNTYSGATTVDSGTLALGENSSIADTSSITVNTDGTFDVSEVSGFEFNKNIINNGQIAGDVSLGDGAKLTGSGNVDGSLVIGEGSTLSPGNSIGLSTATSAVWESGGTFLFEINDADGDIGGYSDGFAGTDYVGLGWDAFHVDGSLDITATVENPFIIDIRSLVGDENPDNQDPGEAANFDPLENYTWQFVSANSITGFDSDVFTLDTSGFENQFAGIDGFFDGTFSISQNSDSLFINYSAATVIPEPGSLIALGLAGAGWGFYRRNRRARLAAA